MLKRILCIAALVITVAACSSDIGYDPSADSFAAVDKAAEVAGNENKLILIISGGTWCRWCHILNNYLKTNKTVYARLNERFVIVKIYRGDKNDNERFFVTLPASVGVPHFWVLSKDKLVLAS